jgi:sulfur dioxygenase
LSNLALLDQLRLRLVHAIDTHTHADHITALGDLRNAAGCVTLMGKRSKAPCASGYVHDRDVLRVADITSRAIYTPGHTDESFSFILNPAAPEAVFTGDVLLIGGSGRIDFQGGDPRQSYRSIVDRLFVLLDATLVYPAHDYNGRASSTIGIEKRMNPRIAGKSEDEFSSSYPIGPTSINARRPLRPAGMSKRRVHQHPSVAVSVRWRSPPYERLVQAM